MDSKSILNKRHSRTAIFSAQEIRKILIEHSKKGSQRNPFLTKIFSMETLTVEFTPVVLDT